MLIPITEGKAEAKISAYHYISMPRQVYIDLCHMVDHYKTEVSGCGMVERIEHRFKSEDTDEPDTVEIEFAIKEVYLPNKQDNSGASTDIDDDCIAELVSDLLAKGKNTEHLRLHWHSHADMDTFHSGTDEENYATLSNGDFLVSLVLNRAHKILGRVDYFKPVRVTLNNLGVHMEIDIKDEPSKEITESLVELDKHIASTPQFGSRDISTYTPRNWKVLTGKDKQVEWDDELSDYGYNNNYELEIQEERESNIALAQSMGISRAKAESYLDCASNACHCCQQSNECQEFLLYVDKHVKY